MNWLEYHLHGWPQVIYLTVAGLVIIGLYAWGELHGKA